MGRGIARFEYAMIYETYLLDADDYDFYISELVDVITRAMGPNTARALGDKWLDNDLQLIAENDRVQIALQYEDTFVQIVALPRTYKRAMRQTTADARDYDRNGDCWFNARGVGMLEALVPYNIEKDYRRIFRRILRELGTLDEKGEHYKNFAVRKCAWTSEHLHKDAFKQTRRNAAKAA